MSIREALDEFQDNSLKIRNSLEKLRDEVKKEGSSKIHRCMLEDKFDEASKIMKMLEGFVKVELKTNYDEISKHVHDIFLDEPLSEEQTEVIVTKSEEQNEALSFIEREIIEEIGYTSSSRIAEMKTDVTEQNILSLVKKGYLDYEKVRWGKDEFGVFTLTEKGKLYFRQTYGIEAKKKKEETATKKSDINISETVKQLEEANFEIVEKKDKMVEIKIDNKSCYVLLASSGIESQMDEHYRLKNIGMLCENTDKMSIAMEDVKKWVLENKDKSRFLAVHFTTPEILKEQPNNPFKSVRF